MSKIVLAVTSNVGAKTKKLGVSLIVGILSAIILSQKIACQSFNLILLPQHFAVILLGICFWQLS